MLDFEELDRRSTPIGEVILRRRVEPTLDVEVYEVKVGDEYLMSSLFTVAEIALARLSLAAVEGDRLDVVVGGLGLGYTARAALQDPRVSSVHVVEALEAVIDWHERRLVPLGHALVSDERCQFVRGDFFQMVAEGVLCGSEERGHDGWNAVVVDIDHSPRHHLHPRHARFYTRDGVSEVAACLRPGGVFGLWSDDAPDDAFVADLEAAFASAEAHVVTFPNFYTGERWSATVYVAAIAPASRPAAEGHPSAHAEHRPERDEGPPQGDGPSSRG
ncbi:MAG TPA: spermidine synthase [Acidimicrobiia bacterium]|nr:spermidine synthase [Acidimicrobiia bacterium]